MKTILDIYREILLRAEHLKDSKLSGDGYLELCWVAEMLEQTEEVNPSPKYPPQPKKKGCKCPIGYHKLFDECRGY